MAKAKRPSAKAVPKRKRKVAAKPKQETPDIERFVKGKSKDITLEIGEVTVRDLEILDIIVLMGKYAQIFSLFLGNEEELKELDESELLAILPLIPNLREKIAFFFAVCCGVEDQSYLFERLSSKDTMLLIETIREVLDFDRIKTNFLAIDLQKFLQMKTFME